jgi:hypothetical protein
VRHPPKHFNKHGAEVGAENLLQYLRKASQFSTKGAQSFVDRSLEDGTLKWIKNGKYIIKTLEGKIVSFGLER